MKVNILFNGAIGRDTENDFVIEYIVDGTELELSRVPNIGEEFNLWMYGYWLQGKVGYVSTDYCKPHPNIKERAWGEHYCVGVKDWEIMDVYDDKEAEEWRMKANR